MSATMIIIIGMVSLLGFVFLYKRYFPVYGINKCDLHYESKPKDDIILVDTRDYQTSTRHTLEKAYCLPLPYLNRHFHDLPHKDIVIIAADHVEKNLSARILRKHGHRVIGYYLMKDM